jgi:hypothetical protein
MTTNQKAAGSSPAERAKETLQNAEKLESREGVIGGFGSSRAAVDYESASSSAVAATSLIPGIMCE